MVWCFPKAWALLCLLIVVLQYSWSKNTEHYTLMTKRHSRQRNQHHSTQPSVSVMQWSRIVTYAIYNYLLSAILFNREDLANNYNRNIINCAITNFSYAIIINSHHLVGHGCKNLQVKIIKVQYNCMMWLESVHAAINSVSHPVQ